MADIPKIAHQLRSYADRIKWSKWSFPFALLVICTLSYGNLISKMGFYWDDWFITYYTHFFGAGIFPQATAIDRPMLGWLYVLTTSLIGESRIGWQILSLAARWLLGISLWLSLTQVWPDKPHASSAVALLFVVYPSFQQQHIAITFGISFLIYSLFFISIASMVAAQRKKHLFWLFTLLSLLTDIFQFFTAEYFFGLELLRPALLWLIVSESTGSMRLRLRKTILQWSPYAVVLFGFTFYRLLNETPRGEITFFDKLSSGALEAILGLANTIIGDSFMVSVQAWGKTMGLAGFVEYGPAAIVRYMSIFLLCFVVTYIYLANRGKENSKITRKWAWQVVALGVLALLVAGIPFWMTGLKMSLDFTRDRFTLPMMIGASLLIYGMIALFTRKEWQSAIIIALLVSAAASMHFKNALSYRKEWLVQQDFFRQLVWRAPGITPGTILLTTDMPFTYNFDGSLTAPLNWIYAPENSSFTFTYLYYDVESHLSRNKPELVDGMPIEAQYRLTSFRGSLSQAILVIYTPPGCLKVVDPILDRRLPNKPRYFREALPYSNPNLILTNQEAPAQLPANIFGVEPEAGWCYYFEKADLARQIGDWQKVSELGDLALSSNKEWHRSNVAELLPFIEGYARSGQVERAVQLSLDAFQTWENIQLMLCDLWQDIAQTTDLKQPEMAALNQLLMVLQCTIH